MICWGILVDSEGRAMSEPPEKLGKNWEKIVGLCQEWKTKKSMFKKTITVFVRITVIHLKMCKTCKGLFESYAFIFEANG